MSSTAVTWIVIGVIVVLVLWIISIYNGLVAMRQRVNQAFSDIDVQTKQRHDLIPNLVETVKGYAGHNAVQEYNTGIQQFPAVLLAGALGFAPKDFFDVGVEERKVLDQAPQVKF